MILISNLLFQLEHKGGVFVEALRVLRPRGRLAVIDWQESFRNLGPVTEHVVSKAEAIRLATDHGFVLQKEFPL